MPSWLKTGLIACVAVIALNALAKLASPVKSLLNQIPGNADTWG